MNTTLKYILVTIKSVKTNNVEETKKWQTTLYLLDRNRL